jgi:hypothetical protein
MKCERAIWRPQLGFQEYSPATRLQHSPLANAWAHGQGREKTALDLDCRKPPSVLREGGHRNADVGHRHAESALNLIEVISKCRLFGKLESNLASSHIGGTIENGVSSTHAGAG